MKKMLVLSLLLFACGIAKADVEQFNRVVFDEIVSFSFSGEQINFTLAGQADGEEEVETTGTYTSAGLTYHASNFKKVQTYQIEHNVLTKIMFLWSEFVGEKND